MNYGKFFSEAEFKCSHCGASKMDQGFVDKLNILRESYGKPLRVTSGYRCPDHPVEIKKASSGAHTSGRAVDLAVQGADAYKLLDIAMRMGFKGVGVQQKGTGRFIHLDDWQSPNRPTIWSY